MSSTPRSRHAVALQAQAAELRGAAVAGVPERPLRGRNIALLTPDATLPTALALSRAALALGAQVVHVRPESLPAADAPNQAEILSLLGRLYDAVVADGVSDALVAALAAHVDRPVLIEDAADDTDGLDPWLLQAWLLDAIA